MTAEELAAIAADGLEAIEKDAQKALDSIICELTRKNCKNGKDSGDERQ